MPDIILIINYSMKHLHYPSKILSVYMIYSPRIYLSGHSENRFFQSQIPAGCVALFPGVYVLLGL